MDGLHEQVSFQTMFETLSHNVTEMFSESDRRKCVPVMFMFINQCSMNHSCYSWCQQSAARSIIPS